MTDIIKVTLGKVNSNNHHKKEEQDRVVTDLLKNNKFSVVSGEVIGPFLVDIKIFNNKVLISAITHSEEALLLYKVSSIQITGEVSLAALRRVIKDYSIICASYFEVIKNSDSRKIEAIDMARRGLHNEGAEILQSELNTKFTFDLETARKLFSLIYLLQEKC